MAKDRRSLPIHGKSTQGFAACTQMPSFELAECAKLGKISYIETLDAGTIDEIVNRVVSILDPSP